MIYEIANRNQDAVDEYRKVTQLLPDNPNIYYNLSWALIGLKKYIEAIAPLQKAIELNPKNSNARYSLGWVYSELNRHEEAISELKKTIQIDSNHIEAGNLLNTMQSYIQRIHSQKQKKFSTTTSRLHDKPEIVLIP